MYRLKRATVISSACFLLLLTARPAEAQLTGQLNYFKLASDNWNVPSNWSLARCPMAGSTTSRSSAVRADQQAFPSPRRPSIAQSPIRQAASR